MPTLPSPRGEITELLVGSLRLPPEELPPVAPRAVEDTFADGDLQLALYLCYELHYRGFDEVDERWEWSPSLLALRAELERVFEDGLCQLVDDVAREVETSEIDLVLRALADADEGPSLSRYLERDAELEQMLEFMIHRSAYQLKEADPHSWALPRLAGPPKAALVEIQADEYGGGRAERIHAQLFADALAAVGLDPTYGAYLECLPAVTLATVNLMSLFGLHRRWRGAIIGHLALFEMTSSIPNRRYANGLRRLGHGRLATAFFDEHVEADAVHENIAAVDLAGGLARQQPELAPDIVFGARALAELDRRFADHVLGSWSAGRSSLRAAAPARAAV